MKDIDNGITVDLFHLERVASILDSPPCYGIRLEFLDIEMNREEQLAFFATWGESIKHLQNSLDQWLDQATGDIDEHSQPVTVEPNHDLATYHF